MARKTELVRRQFTGHCYKCKKPVTQDDFCHGCQTYICSECDDNADRLMGPHDIEDHFMRVEPDPRD